ncbi:hypothetical protein DPEC_G00012010 [Dallia pectoralis]|uniref:Uncharacterized protein n=1 Tax=Dallia pectoralis TaxID=75939 RepID=A0ACC2HMB7_DALPE|nr:hypothetical protein DPEC_G00012010 [Dallia pectoralis]
MFLIRNPGGDASDVARPIMHQTCRTVAKCLTKTFKAQLICVYKVAFQRVTAQRTTVIKCTLQMDGEAFGTLPPAYSDIVGSSSWAGWSRAPPGGLEYQLHQIMTRSWLLMKSLSPSVLIKNYGSRNELTNAGEPQ